MVRNKKSPSNSSTLYPGGKRRTPGSSIVSSVDESTSSSISQTSRISTSRLKSQSRKQVTPKKNVSSRNTTILKSKKRYIKILGQTEVIPVKTLQEIRSLQRTVHHLIPKLPFSRLVREIMMEYTATSDVSRVHREALSCIQESAELYITGLFADCNLAAHHAKRKTVNVRDMGLVLVLRQSN